jgi:glycosyltransferase involved in cell wall biosynthesis
MEPILMPENNQTHSRLPLVSVVIPVYNGENFVDACLDSIAAPTYRPLEIIVINDGSTDGSGARAENHRSKPAVITIPHSNLPSARNEGIRRARGDYIAFCDVDDLWMPPKLEKQAGKLSASPEIGLVFTAVATIGATAGKPKKRRSCRLELNFNTGDQFAILAQKSIIAPSSVMIRRTVLEKTGLFDEDLFSCEDWDLWLRIARSRSRMHRLDEPLTLYRRHGANMSKKVEVMHASRMRVLEKAFEGLAETPALLRLKNKALASAWFEAANSFYSSGDYGRFRATYKEARRYGHPLTSPKALRRFIRDRFRGK